MAWDRSGQLIEAIDCFRCNSMLEWHGDLPDDEEDWLCQYCAEDAAFERGNRCGAAVAFGLMGMAEALQDRARHLDVKELSKRHGFSRECVLHSFPYAGGQCFRCGFDDGWRRSDE